MPYSLIASTIFAARNVDKTRRGDVGRSAVAAAQGTGVVSSIFKLDKIANTASKAVNPLIVASSAIKVARADDKITAGITETGAIASMFAVEHFVKTNYDKFIKIPGKFGAVLKGATLVAASIAAYDTGRKLSSGLAHEAKANFGLA